MRPSAPPRRPRVTRMAALTAVVVLGVAGCTGPEGRTGTTTTDGPGTSTSPPPVVGQSEAAAHPADTLPLGDEPWAVVTLTRGGEALDPGPWRQVRIDTSEPFILAAPELCPQPRFGITAVTESAWEATPDVAQPAIGCVSGHEDEAAVAALRELFDGTVQVTPPGGADVEMRLRRADVELVLSEEG